MSNMISFLFVFLVFIYLLLSVCLEQIWKHTQQAVNCGYVGIWGYHILAVHFLLKNSVCLKCYYFEDILL